MIENNNEKRNKKMTVALVVLILVLVAVVGITYAYFSAKSEAGPQPVTTAKVDLFVEVDPEATNIKDIKPTTWNSTVTENDNNLDIVQIPIKVTNKSTIDIDYDLFITPNGLELNEDGLDGDDKPLEGGSLSDIKYKLYETTGNALSESPIKEGDFTKGESKQKIVSNKKIKALEEGKEDNIQKYILYIYIENKDEDQNKLQGIDFNLDIEGVTPAKKIAKTILAKETPIEEQPDFTIIYTDKGLYKLQGDIAADEDGNNIKDIYYYRGAVTNNYVKFGTYTKEVKNMVANGSGKVQTTVAIAGDPILWRIIKINEDESIALIAEHNIGDERHIWNNINKKPDYVITNEDGSTTDSNIKKLVDDWYNETFVNPTEDYQENKKLEKLIKETEFCNDKSDSYTGVIKRLRSNPPKPTLKCADSKDILRLKAGLITADEMVYAGALYGKQMTSNIPYLSNKTTFWTISPNSSSYAFHWEPTDILTACRVTDTCIAAARPVITLSPDVPFSYDKDSEFEVGTENNPWVIG